MIIENTLKNAIGALEVEVSNVGMERFNLEAKKPSPQIARRLDALSQLESALEVSKDHLKILSRLIRDYDDSQARLADAQARAERAEGDVKLLRVAFAEASHNDCQAGIEIDALKKQLSAIAPQGRTDGEPWQISRAVDALEWAFSAVLLAEPRYANTESYQIHEATLNGLRGMIGKPATAPEVKGGAA